MATQQERDICTAPTGQFIIVHIDPRDHWPTREGFPKSTLKEVQSTLSGMLGAQCETMQVFNDKGKLVLFELK